MVLKKLLPPMLRYSVAYALATLAVLYGVSLASGVAFGMLVMLSVVVAALAGSAIFYAADDHIQTASQGAEIGFQGSTDPSGFVNRSAAPTKLKVVLYTLGVIVFGIATAAVMVNG